VVPHPLLDPQALAWQGHDTCPNQARAAFQLPVDPATLAADHAWLEQALATITMGDTILVATVQPQTPDQHYQVWLQREVPDAHPKHRSKRVNVLQYTFCQSARRRDEQLLIKEVRDLGIKLATHEIDEELRQNGQLVSTPH